ncbi:hypothetical protein [Chitinophaga sp. sic0106]|uniref:hypothetical protein n=1 Tax=Chitinophaga sp. sic0106 TaxID=2854785 RepID=UPI001C4889DB|nr:hypothetical protein [Chitinophaga sp. sic0106]MBV7534057.1 hypothetical protein [Chitinophaga sp. sic0106]
MITIVSTPQKFTPAFNPVVFALTSDNYALPGFQYVADVYSGAGQLLATLKYQPPVTGTDAVVIDLAKMLSDLVGSNYLRIDSTISPAIVAQGGGCVADYSVQFGEQYSGVIHGNLASYSGYVFNGAIDQLRWPWFDYTDYANTKFLTLFQRQTVRKRDNMMLSMLQLDTVAVTGFDIKVYNSAGTQTYTTTISNPYTSLSNVQHRALHLCVGFDYLYARLGFSSTIYSQAAYYTIAPAGGAAMRIDLYSQCERFPGVRLRFLNQLGGFDSFNFMLDQKASQSTERKQTLRQPGNRATGYDAGNRRFEVLNRNYYTRTVKKLKAISDYLTDDESKLLGDMLDSPLAYQEADATEFGGTGIVLLPVNIKTTDYEQKKSRVDKLFNLEVDLEISTDNYRQVI